MILRKNKVEEFWSGVTSACNGLEWGLGSQPGTEVVWWRWKHQVLATRPVVNDKGAGPWTLQKRISAKKESSEARKVFIRRKKSTVRVDRQMGRLRGKVSEFHPHSGLNYFYGAFLPRFLWRIILICLIHSPYLISGSSHMYAWTC